MIAYVLPGVRPDRVRGDALRRGHRPRRCRRGLTTRRSGPLRPARTDVSEGRRVSTTPHAGPALAAVRGAVGRPKRHRAWSPWCRRRASTVDRDGPAVQLDVALRDGQAEAGAGRLGREVRLEDPRRAPRRPCRRRCRRCAAHACRASLARARRRVSVPPPGIACSAFSTTLIERARQQRRDRRYTGGRSSGTSTSIAIAVRPARCDTGSTISSSSAASGVGAGRGVGDEREAGELRRDLPQQPHLRRGSLSTHSSSTGDRAAARDRRARGAGARR